MRRNMKNTKHPSDNLLRGEAIRSGEPKRRVGVNYEPGRVVLLVRTYEEADKAGNILEGFNNNACAYYHLPLLCASPMDYYLSTHVLGHVRLTEVKQIGSRNSKREVTRMYKESHPIDKRSLVAKHRRGE